MSLTLKRLESNALREVAIILTRDSKNKKLSEVTVTEVRITNDLSYMTIFYTTYFAKDREDIEKALEEASGFIRASLAKKLSARKMPELIFKYDEALEYGNHMNEVISSLKIKHDDEEKGSLNSKE